MRFEVARLRDSWFQRGSFWPGTDAANPSDQWATMFAGRLPVGWRRNYGDDLVRWSTFQSIENGRDLIAICCSYCDRRVEIACGWQSRRVQLGELAGAGRCTIHVISERWICRCVRTRLPCDPHAALRQCGRGAQKETKCQHYADSSHFLLLSLPASSGQHLFAPLRARMEIVSVEQVGSWKKSCGLLISK